MRDWAASLTSLFVDQEWAEDGADPSKFGITVTLEALSGYSLRVKVMALQHSFSLFIKEKGESNDAVVAWVMQFYSLVGDFVLFDSSIKVADTIAVELILSSWIVIFAIAGKVHYVNLVAAWLETACSSLSPSELEESRLNQFVRLNPEKKFMAKDDLAEKVNEWMKKERPVKDVEMLVKRSVFLSWKRRCGRCMAGLFGGSVDLSGSTPIAMTPEMQTVYRALEAAKVTTDQGRQSIPPDLIWSLLGTHSQTKQGPSAGPPTRLAATASSLFGKGLPVYFSREEVKEQELAADDEHCGGGAGIDDGAESVSSREGGAASELGEDVPLRRYPWARRSLDGPWRDSGEEMLVDLSTKRLAEREKEARRKGLFEEAATRHEMRTAEIMAKAGARIGELRAKKAAAASGAAMVEDPPSYKADFDLYVASGRSD